MWFKKGEKYRPNAPHAHSCECTKDYGVTLATIKRQINVMSTFVNGLKKVVGTLERRMDVLEDRLNDVDAYNAKDQETKNKQKNVISK